MKRKPRVAAGIINYQNYHSLHSCLESLNGQTLALDEVILIDNFSIPDQIRPVAEVNPGVKILAQDANQGYAGGANRVIQSGKTFENTEPESGGNVGRS